jgi:uncharacterized repeat protein (TIGR01451 family)
MRSIAPMLPGMRVRAWHRLMVAFAIATLVPTAIMAIPVALAEHVGAVTGTVTDVTTGSPIERICVWASLDPTGQLLGTTTTDAEGHYTIGGLPSGWYRIRFADRCDGAEAYVLEWYDDHPSFVGSDLVGVSGPETTTGIDAALVYGGTISGTVIDDVTGQPLPGICVSGSPAGSGGFPSADITDTAGRYSLGALASGLVAVRFADNCDGSVDYVSEWFDDKIAFSEADFVTVTAPNDTPAIDAALVLGGSISGTVTDQTTGEPLERICVRNVDRLNNADAFAMTDAEGRYTLRGVGVGTHRVRFADECGGSGDYLAEWYDDQPTFSDADLVTVVGTQDTPGIDAGLTRGGSISGTVTDAATGEPLQGICVSGGDENVGSFDETDAAGHYTLRGLPTGRFGVGFFDLCSGTQDYRTEYFDNRPSFAKADGIAVTAPEAVSGIDAALTPIVSSSDLTLGISDRPDPAVAGRPLTYRITIKSRGPDTATGVTVTVRYPAGTELVSVTPTRGNCTVHEQDRSVMCDLGDMIRGILANMSLVIIPNEPATIVTAATVSASGPDPDPSNNSDSESTRVLPG